MTRITRRFFDRIQLLNAWRELSGPVRQHYANDRRGILNDDPPIDAAIGATSDWLCEAQARSATTDGGVARHYSIVTGWGPSYPETTGYIVPTLLNRARATSDARLEQCARDMLDWLVRIQLDDGAFQGGTVTDRPVAPVTFNTGQILMGLSAGAAQFGAPYVEPMHRAAAWLVDCMDEDGCWRRNQSPFARSGEKTYEAHTAWGLLEAKRASGEEAYAEAALRNIRWAAGKQLDNGWFEDCCLTNPDEPLTHTIGYALRGIIEGYVDSGDDDLLAAAKRAADALTRKVRADGMLPGRFDRRWNGVVNWVCLTGSVQIAHCWLQLHQITGDEHYLSAARRVNRYVRCTVDMTGAPETRGGIRGSFPIHGEYGRYQYLNWAAKFFIDSNLLELSITEPGS